MKLQIIIPKETKMDTIVAEIESKETNMDTIVAEMDTKETKAEKWYPF